MNDNSDITQDADARLLFETASAVIGGYPTLVLTAEETHAQFDETTQLQMHVDNNFFRLTPEQTDAFVKEAMIVLADELASNGPLVDSSTYLSDLVEVMEAICNARPAEAETTEA